MLYRFINKVSLIYKKGILYSFRIFLDKMYIKIFQLLYGFDKWHVNSPTSARPYRRIVAEMVNSLDPVVVVEVGCGLGEILSLTKSKVRHGYDIDTGVIKAARLIRNSSIQFSVGDLSTLEEDAIDVLILVNWIHEINWLQLNQWLTPIYPRIKYILVDAIDSTNNYPYKYKHDFKFLNSIAIPYSSNRCLGEGRTFIIFKVTK